MKRREWCEERRQVGEVREKLVGRRWILVGEVDKQLERRGNGKGGENERDWEVINENNKGSRLWKL